MVNFNDNKIPLHSADVETAILAECLVSKTAIALSGEIINSDMFFVEKNAFIYNALIELFDVGGSACDIIAVAEHLAKKGLLEAVGGTYYITELNAAYDLKSIRERCFLLKEYWIKREVAAICKGGYYDATNATVDALDLVTQLQEKIYEIDIERYKGGSKDIFAQTNAVFNEIERLKESPTELIGIATGLKVVDRLTKGFKDGDYIVIAGRPSMGKTAFALQISNNISATQLNVVFISIEMNSKQLIYRMIGSHAGVNSNDIQMGQFNDEDYINIQTACDIIKRSDLTIEDPPNLTPIELKSKLFRLNAKKKIDIVIVDYMQLMDYPKAESREREVSYISKTFKAIAKEFDIPVVALAQLNRGVESRTDKRPMLSDLRESGSIEQDADIILFITRPERYGIEQITDHEGFKHSSTNMMNVICGKNRNGPIGDGWVVFNRFMQRITDWVPEERRPEELKQDNHVVGDYYEDENDQF